MEEQNLKRLFLWDLRSDEVVRYRFRFLVFYGVAVLGFVAVLLESVLLAGNPLALRLFGGAPFYPFHFVWIAFGCAGALLAFKKEAAA